MVGGIFQKLRKPRFFLRDNRGVSAVEFAIVLPVMIVMYLGCNEVGNGLTVARKVTHITSTLSDLVTQSKSISSTDMTNILNAASSILTPYPSSVGTTKLLKIKVSQFKIDANSKVTVDWSSALNDTALTKGATITNLPAGVKVASTYLISAEVHYAYTPTIGYVMTGTFDLHDQFYLRPRLSDSVTGPS
jgi:Flp pilus assembly protein TadG